jgi:hypothetical protein
VLVPVGPLCAPFGIKKPPRAGFVNINRKIKYVYLIVWSLII